ncbi:MAG: hypothetical protein RB191_12855 [Terriglobia bacterium]|nr:hypothetical protein [Terriglobia bacterium]
MEKSLKPASKERFMTVDIETREEGPLRLMTLAKLGKCHAELKRQYEQSQIEFVAAMNQQLTLRGYLAAIEFEQERRGAGN